MKLKEDSQLNEISKKFSEAVKKFTKRNYKEAAIDFENIIEKYVDSEFYSVLEIQSRAKSYKNICDSKTSRKKNEPETENSILNELLIYIGTDDYTEAEKTIKKLETKKINSPYSMYLRSLLAFRMEDVDAALGLLKKTIAKDDKYKIIANNEPDLQELQENEEFLAIIE
ncbi:MAG: hypothetical protein KAS97_11040 [Candidatus Aminicenantes bacterium]|nr:hypothetical protein [Candidatus Aminicenantes bacterium]